MSICTFQVMHGPSKYDLQKALFDRKGNGGRPHHVTFKTDKGAVTAIIRRVSAEDGTGELWLISGFISKIVIRRRHLKLYTKFEGYYNTINRKGSLDSLEFFEIPMKHVRIGDVSWVGSNTIAKIPVLDEPSTGRWYYKVKTPRGEVINQYQNTKTLALKQFVGQ